MRHLLPEEIPQKRLKLDCDHIKVASINWGMDNDSKLLFRMKTFFLCGLFALGVSVFAADKPNILLILADDLGYGDVGFCGYWTLEMFAVQPVRVYPGVPICEIFYHTLAGDVTEYQSDKYQHNQDIQPSLLFREFQQEHDPQMRLSFGQELAK